MLSGILARIEERKAQERAELKRALAACGAAELRAPGPSAADGAIPHAPFLPDPATLARAAAILRDGANSSGRSLAAALRQDRLTVIAEIKRRSPSAGAIATWDDPVPLASAYASGGAAAMSVLTDVDFFGGSPSFLPACRGVFAGPVLRKDFLGCAEDLALSRALGADAVLLIVAVLGERTAELLAMARSFGLEALVEVHDADELDVALAAGARIVGVNHRDLTTFTVDLGLTERLSAQIPRDVVLVGESGIRSPDDARRMRRAGADAVLVGESLARAGGAGLEALRISEPLPIRGPRA